MPVTYMKSKSGWYVLIFFSMFLFFMVWYFLICSEHSLAPSDFALVSIAVVCAVECVVAAWIKTRPPGEGLTEKDEKTIEFIASVVGRVLDIETPSMQSTVEGESKDDIEDEGYIYTDDESEEDDEPNDTNAVG